MAGSADGQVRTAELRTAMSRMDADLTVLRRLVHDLIAAGILEDAAYADLWHRIQPWAPEKRAADAGA